MSTLTRKLLRYLPAVQRRTRDIAESPAPAPIAEEPAAPQPNSADLGLFDSVLSGWYQNDTNEVFRGIPIGADDVVVDVGCGNGGSGLFCAKRGAKVIAIDIDPQVIADTRTRLEGNAPGGFEAYVSDANPLPLADGIATRVLCTEVLEHVDDPYQVMRELYRIGKPGARYLLTAPDALQEHLQERVAPPVYFQKPNHIRIIEREAFVAMAERAGLVVEDRAYYGFFWSIWMALFWSCKVDLGSPNHPVLNHWTQAWGALLSTDEGKELKHKLDAFMPKSQVLVARKP
ncbi:class I SAM-dependent methyltransferase [Dyella acidiphila]|uniref:Methyltransferase domain-containing protein n=1 Tax=Dyella acidiphila TaxID=2775866 RepID=A0ABR9G5B2_9GAMM|nr:class I SAM-dependent methyltransferase [Dyella acidiphila]MBE1159204.1 methyltransferase domain-containing protein [Dyella acidiphila]